MSEHIIDLGDEVIFKVKLAGKEYKLSEPTARQVRTFQKESKDSKDEDVASFCNFVTRLGLPSEVAADLGITKIKKLAEGLVGGLNEKK